MDGWMERDSSCTSSLLAEEVYYKLEPWEHVVLYITITYPVEMVTVVMVCWWVWLPYPHLDGASRLLSVIQQQPKSMITLSNKIM